MTPCDRFDDGLDELALGLLDAPEEARLLAHAASCPRCQARLDELVALADRLLLVAPEVEPPAGFEAGALARMGAAVEPAPTPQRSRWWRVAAVAAVVVVALGVGLLVGRGSASDGPSSARAGTIVAADGAAVGTVQLVASPVPHVLVSVDQPRPGPGVRTCELVLADGRTVTVGTWSYDEIATGVWAAGIEPALLEAVTMRVLAGDGTVLATADLT